MGLFETSNKLSISEDPNLRFKKLSFRALTQGFFGQTVITTLLALGVILVAIIPGKFSGASAIRFIQVLFLFYAVGFALDIYFKRTAADLEKKANKFQSPCAQLNLTNPVLDSLQEGILVADSDGSLTLVNRAMLDFQGVDAGSFAPNDWFDHFHFYTVDGSTMLEENEHPLTRALSGEYFENVELLLVNQYGSARYCIIHGRPIEDKDKQQLGALIVVHDVTDRRRSVQEVARLASIVECSTEAVIGVNLDSAIVSWNAAATNLFGVKQSAIFGQPASILAQPSDRPAVSEAIKTVIRGEKVEPMELSVKMPDSSDGIISMRFSRIQDPLGSMIGVSAMATDITERKRAEAALIESRQQLAEAQRVARMGSWEYDIATELVKWSAEMSKLFDFDHSKGMPTHMDIMGRYHPDDRERISIAHSNSMQTGEKYEIDVRVDLPSGTKYFQVVGQPVKNEAGEIFKFIGTGMDITQRKQAEEAAREANGALEYQKKALEEANLRLQSLASSDGLTGLKNRRALDTLLEQEFQRSLMMRTELSVIMMDIDKFKTYNDNFGHQAGDDVLRKVSSILEHSVRDKDIVARYGGEELCVVMPETSLADAHKIAERLRTAVENGRWEKQQVTVSLGVAAYKLKMRSVPELLIAADKALYRSKESGRNRVTLADFDSNTDLLAA